jgi:hypothetical protein
MTTSVSFRPQVSLAPTVTQQSDAKEFKSALNQLKQDYNNNQVGDIAMMTKRTDLENKIQDTKTEPVKYVEDVKTNKPSDTSSTEQIKTVTNPAFDKTIKNLQNGKQYSLNEREQMLTSQMNQMAINNRLLHGLF